MILQIPGIGFLPSHPELCLANSSLQKQLRLTPQEAQGPLKLEWVGKLKTTDYIKLDCAQRPQ